MIVQVSESVLSIDERVTNESDARRPNLYDP